MIMPTRFNSKSQNRFGVTGINVDNHQGIADITIPSVGIEDVDIALFKLFENEIKLQVGGDNSDFKKVPVIFATGEKWAILKKKRALRDKNNSLILPLLTISRTSISQDLSNDIAGRGINQQTGEIVIRRRLDKSDRGYQNLINRFLLKNQKNVATNSTKEHLDSQLLTDRTVGENASEPLANDGAWLADVKTNNIYETIVIPSPQFYNVSYEVTMWTQYTQHMNQLLEQIVSSFLPQANSWKLETPKGYWFIATVDNNSYEPENNLDEIGQEERVIKYKFTVNVKSYFFATQNPGNGVPIKRWVSYPVVSFETNILGGVINNEAGSSVVNPFLGSDDPTLPLADSENRRIDQRNANGTLLYDPKDVTLSQDPARRMRTPQTYQFEPVYKKTPNGGYVRVYSMNQASGESVIKPASQVGSTPAPLTVDALLGGLSYHIFGEDD